jgi:uncharacterized protein YfaS (alpha-2-macroglobulin family)
VENDPPLGSELPLSGPITLYFNQPMDRASVEASFRQQLAMSGTFTWIDDLTLVFYPDAPLEPAADFKVSLTSEVRAANGLGLLQPVSFGYRTVDYLRPVQVLPRRGAQDTDPTSAVVVAFNYPVVPLGADQAGLPAAFTLQPSAPGRGEWLNTSTYIFYPEPALGSGREYTVRLNPDLRGTDGSPLESLSPWSFSTTQPRLESVEPGGKNYFTPYSGVLNLDSNFWLTFNQPMDPASLEANLRLLDPAGNIIAGTYEWDQDNAVVTFTPNFLLARDTVYSLTLDGDVEAAGGTPLGTDYQETFRTVPALAITRTDPEAGGVITPGGGAPVKMTPYGSVGLYLTSPLTEYADQSRFIQVEPSVTNLSTWWESYSQVLRINGDFLPERDYAITVRSDLADVWGGTLGQDYTFDLRVGPLEPNLYLTVYSLGIFQDADDPALSVLASNLESVPTTVGSLSLQDFFSLRGPDSFERMQNYRPVDAQTWEQIIDAPTDRAVPVDLFLSPDRSTLEPGLYYIRLSAPNFGNSEVRNLLVSSHVQLTMKISPTDVLVWAVDLRDGALVADAPITVYAEDGSVLAAGQTDPDGLFQAEIDPQQDLYSVFYAVLGQPGEDRFGMVQSSWNNGIETWEYGISSNYSLPGLKIYWYTDRSVYRPGDTVHFRGVVRQAGNGRYTLPDLGSLPVKVTNENGQTAAIFDLPVSSYGTVNGEYTLSADARSGYYGVGAVDQNLDSLYFQVAEYRKPEINLQVDFAQDQLKVGSTLEADINARYFFDAPAGNVLLRWYLYSVPSDFYLPGYQVGPADISWQYSFPFFRGAGLGEMIKEGQAETKPDGTYYLSIPAGDYKADPDKRRRYTLEVTATDESGLMVSSRAAALVNPADFYIGVRSDSWTGQSGQPLGFDVQVVDWQQQPAGVRNLKAEFSKVVWVMQENSTPNPLYATQPTYTPEYTLVDSTSGATNADGQARLSFTPPEPGVYQLTVTGDSALTEVQVWVSGEGQVAWPSLPNKRLILVADRSGYKPGDTASVFVPNPFGVEAPALLTVERGKVMRRQLLTIPATGSTVDLPLSGEDAPNVYLSLVLLGANEQGIPDFRHGYLNLDVEPVDLVLKVELASSPERAGPGDEVTFDVRVTDSRGNPVQGEFSLAVVDLAALALADPNSQDIVPAFYSRQPLAVRTALDLAAYSRLFATQPGGIGGGGGGDGAAPQVVRDYFPDTAYWNASLVTNADGKATVTLKLPDTLTTWHTEVRGLTQDTRVGQAVTEVVTTKDLLVRPVTPRFLVANDHVQLAAIVQNNTDQPREVSVSLQANGLALDEPGLASQQVTIPAGGRSRVEWWGTAQDVDSVDLVFFAETMGGQPALQDAVRPPLGLLPVLHYNARQAFQTSGILDEGGERLELVSLPRSFDPSGGRLSVELSPSLAAAMMRALDALEHFPYECTEQTVSRFLPNLETYRILQDFGLDDPALKARLDRTLAEGISRLQGRQFYDGGWGWWSNDSPDPYLTAYAVFALHRARQAGVTVDEENLNRAIEYLAANTLPVSDAEAAGQLDRQAFQRMVLVEVGREGQQSALDQLFERRAQLQPWGQAFLAQAYEKLSPGSDQARTLLSDLESSALRSASGAYWPLDNPTPQDMVGPLTNSAIVLYALAQNEPASPLVADAVRFLMSNRQSDGAWNSTYATAWTLMALNHVLKGTGELGGEFTFGAQLNGASLAEGEAGGPGRLSPVTASATLDTLFPDDPNALLIQRRPGSGRLYYTAGLEVARPVDQAPALSQGLSIERAYYPTKEDCPTGDCAPLESAGPGQKVTVRLTLTLPNDAYHLVVEDYIPAGAEILNTSLKTSQLGQVEDPQAEQYDPSQPYQDGWGWWYFDNPQVYDDHIAWAAGYLPAGTYQFTYTLVPLQAGEYQVLPARAWQFYFPDVQANSPGSLFEIKP